MHESLQHRKDVTLSVEPMSVFYITVEQYSYVILL